MDCDDCWIVKKHLVFNDNYEGLQSAELCAVAYNYMPWWRGILSYSWTALRL